MVVVTVVGRWGCHCHAVDGVVGSCHRRRWWEVGWCWGVVVIVVVIVVSRRVVVTLSTVVGWWSHHCHHCLMVVGRGVVITIAPSMGWWGEWLWLWLSSIDAGDCVVVVVVKDGQSKGLREIS